MLFYIPRLIADFLKILSKKYYFDTFFERKQNNQVSSFFWLIAISEEVVLFGVSSFVKNVPFRPLIFICLNMLFLLILSMFYSGRTVGIRFLIVFSLQAINALAEIIAGSTLSILTPNLIHSSSTLSETIIITISGIVSFLIICSVCSLWKTKEKILSKRQVALMCFTPICSLLVLLTMTVSIVTSDDTNLSIFTILVILLIMNIVNHILLSEIINERILRETITNQEKQLYYQSDKFNQLSNAYKETRKIVHEVKRYNNYISICLKNKEYDKISLFLADRCDEIEKRFEKCNTGNLVIDTLITNYSSIAAREKIPFRTDIKIEKKDIFIDDYDLCIILGNILDNSFNEAYSWLKVGKSIDEFEIYLRMFTKGNFFTIYVQNTYDQFSKESKHNCDLYHGYGLLNVESIVSKNKGVYYQKTDFHTYKTTISIPISTEFDKKPVLFFDREDEPISP